MDEDKFAHLALGFFVTFICFVILPKKYAPGTIALACAIGIGIEMYQEYTGSGYFEGLDIFAWIIGVAICTAMVILLSPPSKGRRYR